MLKKRFYCREGLKLNRSDERDTMFARAHYTPGSQAYEDYYKRFPEKKDIDDSLRHRPDLC